MYGNESNAQPATAHRFNTVFVCIHMYARNCKAAKVFNGFQCQLMRYLNGIRWCTSIEMNTKIVERKLQKKELN